MRRTVVLLTLAACAHGTMDDDGDGPDASILGHVLDAAATDATLSIDATPPIDAAPPDAACVTTGDPCTTSDPGACSVGHQWCTSGGAETCVPNVSEQACYDGPPGTAGVGVCRNGTQTCVGSLGTCTGQVLPAAKEDCFNDVDDDCVGGVNQGCPDSLTLGAPRAMPPRGGWGGGSVPVRCPAGQMVGRTDFYFAEPNAEGSGVAIYCVSPTLIRGASSYIVNTTPIPGGYTAIGAGGNTTYPSTDSISCATGGLRAMTLVASEANAFVTGLGGGCSAGTATLNANNTLSIGMSFDDTTGYIWFYSYSDSIRYLDLCNADEALVGYDVRLGSWMDQIQGICAPFVVNYR